MKGLLAGLGGALLGGLTTVVVLRFINIPRFDLGWAGTILLVAGMLIAGLLAIACHEAGHLLAGATVGFRPCLFIVGPLKLEHVSSRWRVGLNRSAPLFGGLAAGIPDHVHNLRRRVVWLTAGGPLGSLLSGLVGLAILVALREPGARPTLTGAPAVLYILLLVFTLASLMITAVALMPSMTHGYASDGSQIAHFLRESPEVEAEVALLAISTTSIAGTRPRDWDPELLARAMTLPPGPPKGPLVRLLAHFHALDRGEIDEARRLIREAVAHASSIAALWRPSILLAAAEFAALHDHDAPTARRLLDETGGGALVSVAARALAEAAVLHAEGKPGVDERLDRAEVDLPNSADKGAVLLAKEQIAELRQRRAAASLRG